MTVSQHEHTRARREALQAMYQYELTGTSLADLVDDTGATELLLIPERPEGVEENDLIGEGLVPYAAELLRGIVPRLEQIDGWIAQTAENWTLERMPIVDRNIIRLAAYEIAFCDDIPTGVAINEAVEIAKAFGGDESPKFVNGVLGKIASRLEGQDGASQEPDGAAAAEQPQDTEDGAAAAVQPQAEHDGEAQ